MNSKALTIGSLSLIGAALASMGAPARADRIATHAADCQNYNASQALDIDYLASGVRNINVAARQVICSIPRSPVPAALPALFYVDGRNAAGTSTTCTFYVYSFAGTLKYSTTFTRVGTWDHTVSVPAGVVTTFDYTSVLCTLPGSGNGVLLGASAP